MITLDTTTRSLEVVLSGAKSTVDCPFVATYEDVAGAGGIGGAPPTRNSAEQNGTTNGATAVTVVAAPSAFGGGTTRQLKSFSLFNADNAAITPTIRLNDNATTRVVTTLTLQTGETLQYNDGIGWQCLDTNGNIKTNQPASSGAASTAQQLATSAWSVLTQINAPASMLSTSSQASSMAAQNPATVSSLQSAASVQSFTSTTWSTISSATSRVKSSFTW